jgi:hypothetical protein
MAAVFFYDCAGILRRAVEDKIEFLELFFLELLRVLLKNRFFLLLHYINSK